MDTLLTEIMMFFVEQENCGKCRRGEAQLTYSGYHGYEVGSMGGSSSGSSEGSSSTSATGAGAPAAAAVFRGAGAGWFFESARNTSGESGSCEAALLAYCFKPLRPASVRFLA